MDPRHPELTIPRMGELISQYDDVLRKMRNAQTSANLAQLEREGSLVVQEICLVAPRLHEAMMQASRQRRHDLSHGIAFGHKPEEKVGKYTKATIGIEEKPVEKPVEKSEPTEKEATVAKKETVAKKATKKKTTKKKVKK